MTMDRHAEIAEKLDAYALGQLSEIERRAVDAHVAVCPACAQELRELADAIQGIGESVAPVVPPAALRQRVLASVAELPQEPARQRLVSQQRPPMRWGWLAAAAVLLLATGIVAFRADQSRRRLERALTTIQLRNDDLESRVRQFNGQTDLALSILTAGDMREIPMTGSDNAASTAARAFMSPTRGLLLVADRMPPPPEGRVYQVWIIQDKVPASAGLLPAPGGRGMLIVTPPRPDASGSITVAITDEPAGGLPAPSGSIRLAGSI